MQAIFYCIPCICFLYRFVADVKVKVKDFSCTLFIFLLNFLKIQVVNGRLLAVGGFNGKSTTCDVEGYEKTTDEW